MIISNNKTNFNKNLEYNFGGGDITSDAGIILIKEFDEKIGFSNKIKEIFKISSDTSKRKHTNSDLVIQRIYQNILGYSTDDSCDNLRDEPLLTKVLDKDFLASQPTMSRLKDRLTEENIIQCELINKILQEKIYEIDKPEHMVLDLDSTNLSTYGKQEDSEYNYHYKARGYHPLMMFNGLNGDLLKVELRKGSCYTSNGVVKFVEDYLKMQSKEYVGVQKLIRGDSGFAVPELYELAEENDMFFCIRLKANAKLYKKVEWLSNEILEESKDENEYICRFDEFYYKADSWKKERKVVVKIEKIPNENALKYMFITTNMDMLAKDIVSVYCNRGKMENFIKECKNGFGFNKMSNRSFIANANKLQQLMLAYNLVNWFKRLCFSSKNKKMQIGTIRTKLFKIGARIVKSSRKSVIKMSSSYPYVNEFLSIMNKIECLQV